MSNYYIATDGKTRGPYTLEQLSSMWKKGVVNAKTNYCEEGGDKWRSLAMLQITLEQSDSQHSSEPANRPRLTILLIVWAILFLVIIILIVRA